VTWLYLRVDSVVICRLLAELPAQCTFHKACHHDVVLIDARSKCATLLDARRDAPPPSDMTVAAGTVLLAAPDQP